MESSNQSEAAVVALYGIDIPEALDDLYPTIIQWFADLGCTCDKLCVVGDSFSGKQGSFKRIHPRLVKAGLQNVESLSVTSMQTDGDIPIFDWKMAVSISSTPSYFVIGVDTAVAEASCLLDLAHVAIKALQPCYGIGYCREFGRGPVLYAIGLGENTPYSGREYEEAVRSTAWGMRAINEEVYRDGILRGVYPYNFLTAPQLQRSVDGTPLGDWIAQSADRGTLTPIGEGVFQWSVGQEEAQSIRDVLQREGIVFLA